MYYLAILVLITILFIATYYYYAPIMYVMIIMLSLLGLVLAIQSPVQIEKGLILENITHTSVSVDKIDYIEKQVQYETVPILDTGFILLFISILLTAIYKWSIEYKNEDDEY